MSVVSAVRCKLACISTALATVIETRRMRVDRQRVFFRFLSTTHVPHGFVLLVLLVVQKIRGICVVCGKKIINVPFHGD